jgi:hypothetical protein
MPRNYSQPRYPEPSHTERVAELWARAERRRKWRERPKWGSPKWLAARRTAYYNWHDRGLQFEPEVGGGGTLVIPASPHYLACLLVCIASLFVLFVAALQRPLGSPAQCILFGSALGLSIVAGRRAKGTAAGRLWPVYFHIGTDGKYVVRPAGYMEALYHGTIADCTVRVCLGEHSGLAKLQWNKLGKEPKFWARDLGKADVDALGQACALLDIVLQLPSHDPGKQHSPAYARLGWQALGVVLFSMLLASVL